MDADAQDNPVQPTTTELLAEVERRRAVAQRQVGDEQRRIIILVDRFVFWLSKHWLAVFNTLAFLYIGLPILAPVLTYLGARGGAAIIHTIYTPLCNQLPQRSWFLFGPQPTYTLQELLEHLGLEPLSSQWSNVLLVTSAIGLGNETLGYKMALCQRCAAIYGTILLFGLIYGPIRRRVRPLPIWAYLLFGIVPMAIDGGYQWLTYAARMLFPSFPLDPHETTPLMRTVTGLLFGLATAWLAYPYVQESMDEFRETLQKKFGWE